MKAHVKKKKKTTYWLGENISYHICDQGLVSRTYKELSNLNIKRKKSPIKQWAKDLNRRLAEDLQMASAWKDAQHY